jgi:hypothetical protein
MFKKFFLDLWRHPIPTLQDDPNRLQMSIPIMKVDSESMKRHAVAVTRSFGKFIRPMPLRPGASAEDFHVMPAVPQRPSGRAQRRFRPAHKVRAKAKGDEGDAQRVKIEDRGLRIED